MAKRFAHIGKSRLTGFLEGDRFDWSFADFSERYGKDVIAKEVKPVVLASPEQIAEIKRLLEIVKIPEADIEKWWKKAEAESWEEFDSDKIDKCIAVLRSKMTDTK